MATLALLFSAPFGIQHANEMFPDWKPVPNSRTEVLTVIAELFPGLTEFEDYKIYSDNSSFELNLWNIGLKGLISIESGESVDSFVVSSYSEEVIKPFCKRLGWRATGGSSGDFIDNSF